MTLTRSVLYLSCHKTERVPQEKRKLAVVLFADIAGYTALMQEDEAKAVFFLNRFKDALESEVPAHTGRIVQFYGDGVLALFDSAVGALECALALQSTFRNKPSLPVRIGLNDGEVIIREGNAFGDSINIASRIESIAVPGSILFSGSVYDQVHNKSQFQVRHIGKFLFKNVNKELDVYALTNDQLAVPKKGEVTGKLKEKRLAWWKVATPLLAVIAFLVYLSIRFANPDHAVVTEQNPWTGSWRQQVESSEGSYLNGTVQLTDSLGILTGRSTHIYEEVDMELTHRLYNIVQSDDQQTLHGRWRSDQLEQNGIFSLVLSADNTSFRGYYTSAPDTTKFRWIGTRY